MRLVLIQENREAESEAGINERKEVRIFVSCAITRHLPASVASYYSRTCLMPACHSVTDSASGLLQQF